MTRHSAFAALALTSLLAAACGGAPPSSTAAAEDRSEDTSIRRPEDVATLPALTPEIAALMSRIRAADKGQLAVSEEDGRFLRLLVVLTKSQKALEIGGASGYSAIWLGLGMRETGGTLTTIEYDPVRAQELKANITAAGLNDVVTVVAGDAFKAVPAEPGSFDFVFIDAWKPDYQKYFDMTFPRLRRGGLILAHNVINKGGDMKDFLQTVTTRPDVLTSIVAPGTEGISITVKR